MPELSQSGHSCAILPAIDGTVGIDNSSPPVSLYRCIATLQLTAVHRDPTRVNIFGLRRGGEAEKQKDPEEQYGLDHPGM